MTVADRIRRMPEPLLSAVLEHFDRLREKPVSLSRTSVTPPCPPGFQMYQFSCVAHGTVHFFTVLFKYAADEQTLEVWGLGETKSTQD